MQLRVLALAAAIALTGCSEDEALENTSTTGGDSAGEVANGNDSGSDDDGTDGNGGDNDGDSGGDDGSGGETTGYGIPGPADPLQAVLQDQLFAALIGGSVQAPEQLPAEAVLTCLNDTVSIKAVDLIDALAADAAAGQAALTAPQDSQLAVSVQDLLLSTGGLLLSLTGDTSCTLDPEAGTGLPLPGDLPSEFPGSPDDFTALLTMLQQGGGGNLPLSPAMLGEITTQLDTVIAQIEQNGGEPAAPLVSALTVVSGLLDGVIGVLTLGADDPAAVPGAIESLLTGLAGNLTALAPSGAGGFNPDQLTSLLDPSQLTGLFEASPIPMPGADGFDPEAAFAQFTGAFDTLVSTLTGLFGSSPIPVPTP